MARIQNLPNNLRNIEFRTEHARDFEKGRQSRQASVPNVHVRHG